MCVNWWVTTIDLKLVFVRAPRLGRLSPTRSLRAVNAASTAHGSTLIGHSPCSATCGTAHSCKGRAARLLSWSSAPTGGASRWWGHAARRPKPHHGAVRVHCAPHDLGHSDVLFAKPKHFAGPEAQVLLNQRAYPQPSLILRCKVRCQQMSWAGGKRDCVLARVLRGPAAEY